MGGLAISNETPLTCWRVRLEGLVWSLQKLPKPTELYFKILVEIQTFPKVLFNRMKQPQKTWDKLILNVC